MRAIYKYPLAITYQQKVKLPRGAKILKLAMQYKTPCIWALVDPQSDKFGTLLVRCLGTGAPMDDNYLEGWEYLDTVLDSALTGTLVWHFWGKADGS